MEISKEHWWEFPHLLFLNSLCKHDSLILKSFWLYSQADVATESNYHTLGFLLSLRKTDFLITLPRTWDFISQFSWRLMSYLNYIPQLKLSVVKGEIKFNFKDFHGHWNSQKLIFELFFSHTCIIHEIFSFLFQ